MKPVIAHWGHNNRPDTFGVDFAHEQGLPPHLTPRFIDNSLLKKLEWFPRGQPLLLYTHNIFAKVGKPLGKGINPFCSEAAWVLLADLEWNVYGDLIEKAVNVLESSEVWQVDNHEGAEFAPHAVYKHLVENEHARALYAEWDPAGRGWADIESRSDEVTNHIWHLYDVGLSAYRAAIGDVRIVLYGGAGAIYGLGGGHDGRFGKFPSEVEPPDDPAYPEGPEGPADQDHLGPPRDPHSLPQAKLGHHVCFLRSLYYHLGAEDYHAAKNPELVLGSMHDIDKTRPGDLNGAIYWDGNSGYMGAGRYAANCAAMVWTDLDAQVHMLWRAHTTSPNTQQGERDRAALASMRFVIENPTLAHFRGNSTLVRRPATWHPYCATRPDNLPMPPVFHLDCWDANTGTVSFPTLPKGKVTQTWKGMDTREIHNPSWSGSPTAWFAAKAHALARKLHHPDRDIWAIHLRDYREERVRLLINVPGAFVIDVEPDRLESWWLLEAHGDVYSLVQIESSDLLGEPNPDPDPDPTLTLEERVAALEVRVAALESTT